MISTDGIRYNISLAPNGYICKAEAISAKGKGDSIKASSSFLLLNIEIKPITNAIATMTQISEKPPGFWKKVLNVMGNQSKSDKLEGGKGIKAFFQKVTTSEGVE
jgi:hypothetical protein